MKTVLKTTVFISSFFIFSCQSQPEPAVTKTDTTPRQWQQPENKFEGVVFASQKDTSCGMPLSAGLEDTAMLNGKVYGFCSKECKNAFVTKLQTQNKR